MSDRCQILAEGSADVLLPPVGVPHPLCLRLPHHHQLVLQLVSHPRREAQHQLELRCQQEAHCLVRQVQVELRWLLSLQPREGQDSRREEGEKGCGGERLEWLLNAR